MKKRKYFILATTLFLSCIPKTYASCTQEEINEFKKIENEYKVTYEFNKETKDYTLKFIRPKPNDYDYKIYYIDTERKCKDIEEDGTITECYNVSIGEYRLEIVGQTENCTDVFKKYTINLPKYNKYSEESECKGIEEFYLCQPTLDDDIDYDTFISRVNTYKRTKTKQEQELANKQKKDDNNLLDEIDVYIKENLIQIIIVAIFIILIVISAIMAYKTIKKSRRLE